MRKQLTLFARGLQMRVNESGRKADTRSVCRREEPRSAGSITAQVNHRVGSPRLQERNRREPNAASCFYAVAASAFAVSSASAVQTTIAFLPPFEAVA